MIIPIINQNPTLNIENIDKRIEFFNVRGKTISVTTIYENGLIHCENGPAVVSSDGHIGYYKYGKPHCEFGPAITHSCGNKLYFEDGVLHNELGAAVHYANGYKEYWVCGVKWHCDDFFQRYSIY